MNHLDLDSENNFSVNQLLFMCSSALHLLNIHYFYHSIITIDSMYSVFGSFTNIRKDKTI